MQKKVKHGRLLQVIELGHPTIRKKAKKVENIADLKFQELIDDLIATVMEVNGVGISAPQVNESIKLFIMASHPNIRYPHAPKMKPIAIINPKIVLQSVVYEKDWEGCLSIPGIRALIPRSDSITVSYILRDGSKETKTYKGFIARIFLHEYDHLEGLVFLDRIDSIKEIISEKEYQKLINKVKK
ncbi:MAG: peptide deformylase [bacterium]|nr:peptide deformylase [bacterium]